MAATYERSSGGHVAERIRPVLGSPDEERLEALAADPGSGWRRTPDTEPDAPAPEPQPPAKSAAKADWIAWAVHCGADGEAAEALTKDQLIEQYGPKGDD